MENILNKKFGVFIFLGLLIGGQLGVFFGAALANPILGVALGALAGIFLGWFIAAIDFEIKKSKASDGSDANPGEPGNSRKSPTKSRD